MHIAELAGDEESDDTSRTFVFFDEGHTLGNLLRAIIVEYPDVKFCGYTVPHPSDSKMHFRIQTQGVPAVEVLLRGLNDMSDICDATITAFDEAVVNHKLEKTTIDESDSRDSQP